MSVPAQPRRRPSSGPGSGGPDDEAAPFTPEVQRQLVEWLSQPPELHMELLGGQLSPKAMGGVLLLLAPAAVGLVLQDGGAVPVKQETPCAKQPHVLQASAPDGAGEAYQIGLR